MCVSRRVGRRRLLHMRRFFMDDSRICHDAEVQLSTAATAAEMDDNLIEILHPAAGSPLRAF
jgi:homoserine acetyltransferase